MMIRFSFFWLVMIWSPACSVVNTPVDVHLFTMQKNSEFLKDWVRYHGTIFGFNKLTIVDTASSRGVRRLLRKYEKLGVTVHYRNYLAFRDKLMHMTGSMRHHMDNYTFLVPLDIDEFVVSVDYNMSSDEISTFSMNKGAILENFNALPISDKYGGKKYKFNTFDAIDCSSHKSSNSSAQLRVMKHHDQNTFLEDRNTFFQCNAKTFYFSEGFKLTDDGNHYGEVLNQSKYCHRKIKCQDCYHRFMKTGLGLVHYSTLSMNFAEVKEKMLHRLSVLPQFDGMKYKSNCSKFKHNTHYCKFNAQLLRDGEEHMASEFNTNRERVCSTDKIFQYDAPADLFTTQKWSKLEE
mmetsp:Transcript_24791/g.41947  ORF Transcript_24791/g.41947 Transcript_24791/m.41947 type:complete len:349 (-) Transcript_24791:333-1379(-)